MSESGRAFRAGKYVLAIVVPGSALALGSIKPIILAVVAILAALAAVLLTLERADALSRNARWFLGALLLLTAWTFLQSVPVPAGIAATIAPSNADIWARAFAPFGQGGLPWHPLSVDPVATKIAVLRSMLYLCVFVGALRVASAPEGAKFLEILVIVATVVMAFAALAHPAFGAERVFGVYRPRDAYSYQVGYYAPLLNVNHLAAYLNIGACVALDLSLRSRQKSYGALFVGALLLLAGASVWAGSRGGMGGLMLGILLTLAFRWSTRSGDPGRSRLMLLVVTFLGGGLLIGLGVSDAARAELANTDLGKLEVGRQALGLFSLAPITGVGRGAFESIFPLVRDSRTYLTSTHPENIVAQWLTEWGAPISAVAAAMIAVALSPRALLSRVRPAAGAWSAVVACVLHDLVDFHLEVPGVVVLVLTCVAIVVAGRRTSTEETSSRSATRFTALAWGGAALATFGAIFVIPLEGRTVAEERERFSAMAIDPSVSAEVFRADLRDAIGRHPAEAFLPLMGAVRAYTFHEGRVASWVGSALEKNPRFGRAHFVLATSLALRNRSQARLEYRLAFENDDALRDSAIREGARLVQTRDEALELVPAGAEGATSLDLLASLIERRLPATAASLDAELLRRDPQARGPLLRQARALRSDGMNGESWCPQPKCDEDAAAAARAAIAAAPGMCEPLLLLAQSRVRGTAEERAQALKALVEQANATTDRLACKQATVYVALELQQTSGIDAMLDEIARFACETPKESVDRFIWLGSFEQDRGHDMRAIAAYKRASEGDPENEAVLTPIFTLAMRAALFGDAVEASEAMVRKHPTDPLWTERLDTAKQQARAKRLAQPPVRW